MFCRNCGGKIENPNAYVCILCGDLINPLPPQKPKFYNAGFVLGILSLCIPFYGFILGVIGLPLACISKRKSSIIMNSIGIALSVLFFVLMFAGIFALINYTIQNPYFHDFHVELEYLLENLPYYYY